MEVFFECAMDVHILGDLHRQHFVDWSLFVKFMFSISGFLVGIFAHVLCSCCLCRLIGCCSVDLMLWGEFWMWCVMGIWSNVP